MAERRWPTLQEKLARQDDVLDETSIRVRPTPEELEAIRAEAEAFLADRPAARGRRPSRLPPARRPA